MSSPVTHSLVFTKAWTCSSIKSYWTPSSAKFLVTSFSTHSLHSSSGWVPWHSISPTPSQTHFLRRKVIISSEVSSSTFAMLKGVRSSSLVLQLLWISMDPVTTFYPTWGSSPASLDLSTIMKHLFSWLQSFFTSTLSSPSSWSLISSASSSLEVPSSHIGGRWETWIARETHDCLTLYLTIF